ncbi:hypothetical protein [Niveibacterium umoris]|uniref:Uncharacterized protein n=1 Tax=Niveibacterium umoris TaxID=1193620 RepID=A0A840BGC1_9RHOO|nr:hypothetical protein [Niveibacterium umoris]MBB4012225.1 hypothetical protein [Niveibacterium umoris]
MWRLIGLSFVLELHRAARAAHLKAAHRVRDNAQAIDAVQIVSPGIRFPTPHRAKEVFPALTLQRSVNLSSEALSLRHSPGR